MKKKNDRYTDASEKVSKKIEQSKDQNTLTQKVQVLTKTHKKRSFLYYLGIQNI